VTYSCERLTRNCGMWRGMDAAFGCGATEREASGMTSVGTKKCHQSSGNGRNDHSLPGTALAA
jgi:hypothetical protein